MKKTVPILLLILILTGVQALPAFGNPLEPAVQPAAAASADTIAGTAAPAIQLNGVSLSADAITNEDGLYLPVRAIGEALGNTVAWQAGTRSIDITGPDGPVSIGLNDWKIKAGSHDYYLQSEPLLINGRTYLEAAFFTGEFGLSIRQDAVAGRIYLTSAVQNSLTIVNQQIASTSATLDRTIQYPVISGLENKLAETRINASIKALADQAVKTGDQNAADLAPLLIQYPDIPWKCQTYFDYRISFDRNGLLSIKFQDYEFAGGAHGSTIQTGLTFDLATGENLALADLFNESADYIAPISGSVKAQLEQRDLLSALFAPFRDIRPDQSFYLADDGVVVFYQQYEIMPYAAGIQEFTVPYGQLNSLLALPSRFDAVQDSGRIADALAANILAAARSGRVVSSVYPIGTTVIEDVIQAWGDPASSVYDFKAKGTYDDFPSHAISYGFNKGMQIYEAVSYAEGLSAVTKDKALEIFGLPAFEALSQGREILGYQAGADYKLALYFTAALDRYSVIYPAASVNMMADDPGRDWPVLQAGDSFSLNLKGNPTTGYTWHVSIENPDAATLLSTEIVPDSDLIGAGSTFTWHFKAGKAGDTKIIMKYYRDWEGEASATADNIVTYNMTIE